MRPPPWSTDTVLLNTTVPVNRTKPLPIARTGEPAGWAMSLPQWPAHLPTGAKSRTTDVLGGILNPDTRLERREAR